MSTIRMTMIGLYDYDPTLFDGADFPEGIDKELAIETILLRCGESPALYQSAPFMKLKINNTARKWYNNIEHMLRAINEDYNPLHNYDRFEEWTENDKKSETTNHSETETAKHSETVKDTSKTESKETNDIDSDKTGSTRNNVSKTTVNEVSAFNSSNYQPSNKTTENGQNNSTDSEAINTQSTNKQSGTGENNRDVKGDNNRDVKGDNKYETDNNLTHNAHLYGNIGVTTSQQMLESEINLRQKINIYDVIAEIFFKELCVYIY